MSNEREKMQDIASPEEMSFTEHTEIVRDVSDELGVITESTRIVGNVATKGHLAVAGSIEGNISAKGNVVITGVVRGNIGCDNLLLDGACHLTTEITATGHVALKEGVVINGKIYCKDVSIMGAVNGDIFARGSVALSQDAVINGNISASSLCVESGAKIKGSMSIA